MGYFCTVWLYDGILVDGVIYFREGDSLCLRRGNLHCSYGRLDGILLGTLACFLCSKTLRFRVRWELLVVFYLLYNFVAYVSSLDVALHPALIILHHSTFLLTSLAASVVIFRALELPTLKI
jgi:hypothetical protein